MKKKYMTKEHFDDLLQGVREAGAHLRGEKVEGIRVHRIEPGSVVAVRAKTGLSQSEFAKRLGISLNTLQNWEQGRRQPTGPARVLLKIADKHPRILTSVSLEPAA